MGSRRELIENVASALNLVDVIEDGKALSWINKATARINQALRINEMLTHVVKTLDENPFHVPNDFIAVKALRVNSNVTDGVGQARAPLSYCPPAELASARYSDAACLPSRYTTFGRHFELAPWRSGSALQLDLWYFAKLANLANDDSTNAVLDAYPDLYEKAALIYGHRHLMEWAQSKEYEGLVMIEIDQLNEKKKDEQFGEGPLTMRPASKMGGRFS